MRAPFLAVLSLSACAVAAPRPAPQHHPATSGASGTAVGVAPRPTSTEERNEQPSESNAKSGEAEAAKVETTGPRLTSLAWAAFIRPEPKAKSPFLGYVRLGSSVTLRSTELVKGDGCKGGFYQVEPRGYICNDARVTLDPTPRFREAGSAVVPASGPFPYRYAISNGAPMYNRIPKQSEQARREAGFGKAGKFLKQPKGMSAHEDLAVLEPVEATDPVPTFLADGKPADPARLGLVRQKIPLGSMLSFSRAFEAEGRTWLLAPNFTLVPADRVRVFKPSTFRGTKLGEGAARLPLAWMRKTPRPKQLKRGEAFSPSSASWPLRTFVQLTGKREEVSGKAYLETTEPDPQGGAFWILEDDATVAEAVKKMPFGIPPTAKWFLVSITQGTLVAYEGLEPAYATLISPGSGGVPVPGTDPVKMSTTPLGTYPVTFKDKATTMSPEQGEDRKFWIADVPYTQYFNPPFALHAAYWHERFGEPTSAGCVNLSPIDAEAMFAWSDPPMPEGWHGVTGAGAKENGPNSWVVVKR